MLALCVRLVACRKIDRYSNKNENFENIYGIIINCYGKSIVIKLFAHRDISKYNLILYINLLFF